MKAFLHDLATFPGFWIGELWNNLFEERDWTGITMFFVLVLGTIVALIGFAILDEWFLAHVTHISLVSLIAMSTGLLLQLALAVVAGIAASFLLFMVFMFIYD